MITHEKYKIFLPNLYFYFFVDLNSVLVYTIIMKRYVEYPDWVEKFRAPGRTIKKTKSGYGLYSCTSSYVKGGKPKSKQTYLGKITPDGFIPKSIVSKSPLFVEYGLSHFIFTNFKRELVRSSYKPHEYTILLGIVFFIFNDCSDFFLKSCYLTYKNVNEISQYRDKISVTRIKTISNKINKLFDEYFSTEERKIVHYSLLLASIDTAVSNAARPTIQKEVLHIIERNGLNYE